jgi:hypothetical protein
MEYVKGVATATSQWCNKVFFNGHPDESISARAHYDQKTSKFWAIVRIIADTVYFWEPMHCARAARTDISYAGWVLRRSQLK